MFLGLSVPEQRNIARKHQNLPLHLIESLLNSRIHEERFTAIEILNFKYKKSSDKEKKKIVDFYLRHKKYINNWDLVDDSAPYILGNWLVDKDRDVLYKLAKSKTLWDRRIAIVSTFAFIKNNDFEDTLKISEILLGDKHDLIHKAVGWMLREIGKRDEKVLIDFLEKHASCMPRTTLRYSIERFDAKKRKVYLSKK